MSAAWEGPDELRAMRQTQRVYDCGPRACYELLRELAADPVTRQDLNILLARYARLDPGTVAALDGRRLKLPIAVVAGGVGGEGDGVGTPAPPMRGAA